MEQFWTVPERFRNFSSHSIFPISAPLRATIIGTSSSYGAERNAFGWEHHLNIAITLAIQYLPSPLRSVPQSLVQALEQFPVPTERSGTLLTIMGTPLEHSHSCKFQATLVVLETFLNRSSTVQNCSITIENSELFNLCLFGLLRSRAERGNNEWCSHHCQKRSAPLRRDDCGAGK